MNEKAKITAVMDDDQRIEIRMKGNILDVGFLLANTIEKMADEADATLYAAVTSRIHCSMNKNKLCRKLASWLKKEGFLHD